jgi:lipopolysaccharide export LptBFGC system permease protein LptF
MPQPDPLPRPRQPTTRRFWRIFRLLVLLSVVIAAVAVILVTQGAGEVHASLIIATALGVGFTVLVGTGLMALAFISNSTGHDQEAAGPRIEKKDEQ